MSRRSLACAWGVLGVLAILCHAMYRLTEVALELVDLELTELQLAALVVWTLVSLYSEGYRGFHLQFAPRVVARAQHLATHRRPHHVVLAPFYCMGLLHATRKRLVVSWALIAMIVVLVIGVRQLDQPWRGIVDAGVVLGLAFGTLSIGYYVARALAGHAMPVSPDVP